jgi:hypothetical protein
MNEECITWTKKTDRSQTMNRYKNYEAKRGSKDLLKAQATT